MSAEQAAAMKTRHAENVKRAKAIYAAEQEAAAQVAARAWAKYESTSTTPSDYLARKGVGAHGLRYSPSGNGTLAVPMCDATGKVWGLQIIRGKKRRRGSMEKEYWPRGLSKSGHYHLIGSPLHIILVAEGYATGATLFEATGLPTAVAFDAGNLMPVAQALHKTYPRAYILVCADDDYLTVNKAGNPSNPDVTAAQNAAVAVGGGWVKPEFPADREGKKLTDFNDLLHFPQGGMQVVRAQIEAALTASGRNLAPAGKSKLRVTLPPVSLESDQGDGERRAEAIMQLDDLVERYIPVDDGTGDYVFDTWSNKIARKTQMIALLPAGVRADDIKRHPLWIERGTYFIDEIGFDPSSNDSSVKLNTWRGWPRQPKEGSCELLLELLAYLCSGEPNQDEVYRWLLCWMAYPLQHPGAKMASAIIMHGPQGTGKSTIFQALAWIYGAGTTRDYSTVLNQRGLEDKFNADWAADRLYILAEEVVTRAEMWHIKNELNELVTGARIRVNPKHSAAYTQRNHINIVYLSNEGQPLPIDNDDRRHLVVYTPPAQPEEFYDQVQRELVNGGYEAFYDLLLNVDLSDFHPAKRPPMTLAKQKLIDLSLPSEAMFVREWQAGQMEIEENRPLPFCPCGGRQLYTAYKKMVRCHWRYQAPRRNTVHRLCRALVRMAGWQGGCHTRKSEYHHLQEP